MSRYASQGIENVKFIALCMLPYLTNEAIFMNDLAIEIKNVGLGIRVGDHDPFHTSIMHKIKTKQVTGLVVAVEKVA